MPELPEVQTVVNDLNKKIRGKTAVNVWTDSFKLFKSPQRPSQRYSDKEIGQAKRNFSKLKRSLIGETVRKIERQGKNVLIYLSHDKILLIHQKMTGHLLIGQWAIKNKKVVPLKPKMVVEDRYNTFIRLIIYFKDGSQLALSDLRKFAKLVLGSKKEIENLAELKALGPDALDPKLRQKDFNRIILQSGPTIKQVLLKPELIAGIGNIYSDEMMYLAKVHPLQSPKKLKETELKRLYQAMRRILRKAVQLRGTSTSDFRDTKGAKGNYAKQLLVYQREGQSCQYCQAPIKRIKVGGRSSHYCLVCQSIKKGRMYKRESIGSRT